VIETTYKNTKQVELTYEDWYNGIQATWKSGKINLKDISGNTFVQYISEKTINKINQNISKDYIERISYLFEGFQKEFIIKLDKSLDKETLKKVTIKSLQSIFGIIEESELSNYERKFYDEYFNLIAIEFSDYRYRNDINNDLQLFFLKSSIPNLYSKLILNGETDITIETYSKYSIIVALHQFLSWLKKNDLTIVDNDKEQIYHSSRTIDEITSIKFKDKYSQKKAILFFEKVNSEILENGIFKDNEMFKLFIKSLQSLNLDCSINYYFNNNYNKSLIVSMFQISKVFFARKQRYGEFDFITNSQKFYYNNTLIRINNWHKSFIKENTDEKKLFIQISSVFKSIKGLPNEDI
jgi:hypothetical protein